MYVYIYVLCYIPILSKYQIKSYVVYGIIYIYTYIYMYALCYICYMLYIRIVSRSWNGNGTCKQS